MFLGYHALHRIGGAYFSDDYSTLAYLLLTWKKISFDLYWQVVAILEVRSGVMSCSVQCGSICTKLWQSIINQVVLLLRLTRL